MERSDTANIIWYLAILTLVGSALFSRQIPLRSAIGMVLTWAGIFALVLTIVSYREELGDIAKHVSADVMGKPRQLTQNGQLRVAMASDGHYWVEGTINDIPARFLIDSGATITALSAATAKAAALDVDTQRIPVTLDTANGRIQAQRAIAGKLNIGAIKAQDLPVVVSPAFGEVNVIGMNLLSRLKSWRVEKREMVLEP